MEEGAEREDNKRTKRNDTLAATKAHRVSSIWSAHKKKHKCQNTATPTTSTLRSGPFYRPARADGPATDNLKVPDQHAGKGPRSSRARRRAPCEQQKRTRKASNDPHRCAPGRRSGIFPGRGGEGTRKATMR